MSHANKYDEFVEHPRFGRGPRFTGVFPDHKVEIVRTSWWTAFDDEIGQEDFSANCGIAIEGTAIKADLSAQTPMTFPFTYYYDVTRKCHSCAKLFIFFAEEQKYWYEELQFYGGVNCHHCIVCRKQRQHVRVTTKRYEELLRVVGRTTEQTLDFIECGISLVEAGAFGDRCLKTLRHAAKSISQEVLSSERATKIIPRLRPVKSEQV